MEAEILKLAMTQGIWAVLSIFLIVYIIQVQKVRDNNQNEREQNYISLIKSLTQQVDVINEINDTVQQVKNEISALTNQKTN